MNKVSWGSARSDDIEDCEVTAAVNSELPADGIKISVYKQDIK